jgi:hypothetical protein
MGGEIPTTGNLEEARAWRDAYTELIALEEHMLGELQARLSTLSPLAQGEARHTNLPALQRDLEQFQERLVFWSERVAELERAPGGRDLDPRGDPARP